MHKTLLLSIAFGFIFTAVVESNGIKLLFAHADTLPQATAPVADAAEPATTARAAVDAPAEEPLAVDFSIPLPVATTTLERYRINIETTSLPETSVGVLAEASAAAAAAEHVPRPGTERPVRVIIPAIGMDFPIENVGVNKKGEMGVPDGRTNNVGWYAPGVKPGATGSAVFAAHVYAAFKKLHQVPVGADVYVVTESGAKLRFVVDEATTYRLKDLSPDTLFNQNDARRLNLITCAGTYIKSWGTYDHRLVLFTKYVGTER